MIQTLIYGVASVSAQSENAMKKLGKLLESEKSKVTKLIDKRRYVDDNGDSKDSRDECVKIVKDSDETFSMV